MELMSPGEKITFLWRLVNATHERKITWNVAGVAEDAGPDQSFTFAASVGRFNYVISSRDDDDYVPFDFDIYGSVGRGQELKQIDRWSTDGSALVDPLRALYQEAKKQAAGLDSVVSDMFEDLAAIDGLPSSPDEA